MFDDIRCNNTTETFQFKHPKYQLLELILMTARRNYFYVQYFIRPGYTKAFWQIINLIPVKAKV